jgi:hypothetical protein
MKPLLATPAPRVILRNDLRQHRELCKSWEEFEGRQNLSELDPYLTTTLDGGRAAPAP